MARLRILSMAQRIGILVAAVFYMVAGAWHFVRPEPYLRTMPPYIPWHPAMVGISGALKSWAVWGCLYLQHAGQRYGDWWRC